MKEGLRRQSARYEEARGFLESIEDEQGANARGREAREAREVRNVRTAYNPNDNDNDNCIKSGAAATATVAAAERRAITAHYQLARDTAHANGGR